MCMPFIPRLANTMMPNRVLALCQLVAYKSLSKQQLSDLLQPNHLNNSKSQFSNVFSLAKEGRLIEEDPVTDKVNLLVNKKDVETPDSFRRLVSRLALSKTELMFYRFTSWYLMRGEKVFGESSKKLTDEFNNEMLFESDSPNKFNDTNVNAWKTWACFLGYGFQHGGIVIPNTKVRLEDLLSESKDLPRGKFIPFADFMNWLSTTSIELDGGELFNRSKGAGELPYHQLSLGLSSGLRALHDHKIIELHYQSDALDTWFLTKCKTHEIIMEVSEINIRR
ncbi:hypothetical protein [Neobacillus sp.]|uniref:hypothetical protein n=1 Tax=Neobacillus sp. TaxID=2675273 RepID=UPI00289B5594|nr:hypothetical protein [Neobacillus sp.]